MFGLKIIFLYYDGRRHGQQRPSSLVDEHRAKARTPYTETMEMGQEIGLMFGKQEKPGTTSISTTARPPRSARSVPREAQPNAAREGVAMMTVLGGHFRGDSSEPPPTNRAVLRAKFEVRFIIFPYSTVLPGVLV